MTVQTWSTDTVPVKDRFEAWAGKMRSLHLDWDLTTPLSANYDATIRYRGSGNLRISDVYCSAFAGRHSPSAETPDMIGIQLLLSGQMTGTYRQERFTLNPGDLFVWDGQHEGTFKSNAHHRQVTLFSPRSRIPRSIMTLLDDNRPLPANSGTGALAIAAGQLKGLAQEMGNLNDDAVHRTVTGLIDILEAAIAPAPQASSDHRADMLAEIQQYILKRLGDHQLSVSSIAATHWISVRSLHLIFAESGTTAAQWIRQQRLEHSRRELANASGSITVTAVAFRWGFTDASHFSRAFKKEFGVPPTAVMPA